jgi:exopolyphosphatase/pppGpp-phosphohydrolase
LGICHILVTDYRKLKKAQAWGGFQWQKTVIITLKIAQMFMQMRVHAHAHSQNTHNAYLIKNTHNAYLIKLVFPS